MPPTNRAVFQPAKNAREMVILPAPYTLPSASQIVVRTHAVAINPVDLALQRKADVMYTWLKWPFVLGMDVAGEVVEVGSGATTRFKLGDRVVGLARGSDEKINKASEGAFQEYVVLEQDLTAHIPSSISYEKASVLPLGLSTAAAGLFEKDQLNLQIPTIASGKPTPLGKTVIIWGGSTSVGNNAIQLATAAGYEVLTTCSPRNFALCKSLGATHCLDYNSKTLQPDAIAALKGKSLAGALTIGDGGAEACMAILEKSEGDKFISMASYPVLKDEPKRLATLKTVVYFVSWIASFKTKGLLKGIKSNFIFGSSIGYNDIGRKVFVDFLEPALEQGTYVASPEVHVFGTGLESIPGACEYLAKGVSAKKVVVTI